MKTKQDIDVALEQLSNVEQLGKQYFLVTEAAMAFIEAQTDPCGYARMPEYLALKRAVAAVNDIHAVIRETRGSRPGAPASKRAPRAKARRKAAN